MIANPRRWKSKPRKGRPIPEGQKFLKDGNFSPYPNGIDGRRVRNKKFWYNNDVIENQFELNTAPEDWHRGRLKSKITFGRLNN